MSETQQPAEKTESKPVETAPAKAAVPKKEPLFPRIENKDKLSRRTLRAISRRRRKVRLVKEPDFAKAFFESKSKNSAARKKTFRTRHAKK